ncbi:MAG TPA: hypothetical protein VGQ62_24920, partial [Chloroflexota bacterium]|nr:hypothetical protein [Chloroflexota bacterium]
MVDLPQLLRVRAAYAGRFDADGRHLVLVADLGGVPQVWGVPLAQQGWPELLVAPPDRAQLISVGPLSGQLVVTADVGGDEHSQLLYADGESSSWRALTDDREHIHSFGGFSPDGRTISYAANTRLSRWFDVYVRDLQTGESRRVLEHDSTNHAGPFSPDSRWLIVIRTYSNARDELWLVDLQGHEPSRQLSQPGLDAVYDGPQWSPDGRSIVCRTDLGRELAAPARIDVASGKVTFLIESALEVDEATVDPTGRRLAYAVNRDGAVDIIVRDLQTGTERSIAGLPPGALYTYWQSGLAWDKTGDQLAISWTASRASPNVFIASATTGEARQVTFAGGLQVDSNELTEPEHVTFPTFDGRQIPALYYPSSGNAANAPCVVF